jgi:hypothetical protein
MSEPSPVTFRTCQSLYPNHKEGQAMGVSEARWCHRIPSIFSAWIDEGWLVLIKNGENYLQNVIFRGGSPRSMCLPNRRHLHDLSFLPDRFFIFFCRQYVKSSGFGRGKPNPVGGTQWTGSFPLIFGKGTKETVWKPIERCLNWSATSNRWKAKWIGLKARRLEN